MSGRARGENRKRRFAGETSRDIVDRGEIERAVANLLEPAVSGACLSYRAGQLPRLSWPSA